MMLIQEEKSYSVMDYILEFAEQDICSFLLRKLQRHHHETYQHLLRVSGLCMELFHKLGIHKTEQAKMIRSALLHDLGKLAIDKSLLDKKGPLDREEWTRIQNHCRSGVEILERIGINEHLNSDMIQFHHENLDGSGYYGLKYSELCPGVKILRVEDSYDAMTQPRAYKKSMNSKEAFEELFRWSDIHYDPLVVNMLYSLKKTN
ncbi:HD-GYP domain-containing protein [Paenibacillus cremeus]|nr:HD domain-containing phosphohydrolase [Paenibacillus cremeus]